MNLSFAGCGFLGIYHVGVAVCFRKYAPHLLLRRISGASAGALSACCMLCELPLGDIISDMLRLVGEARSGSLGPFSPSFNVQNVILEGLEKFLPDDAHIKVSGKLHISLTRVYDGKNVIVSQFSSKEDLLQALLASCFIPVFSGMLPPKFHGIRYMDGGFSDNLPVLDENTITVSPFCGESDICPRDLSSQLFHVNVNNTSIELSKQNINRFVRILFPPNPEVLSRMCKQGFDDALRFLHRNNLISCTRCLSVQSTFEIQDTLDDSMDYDPECVECKNHRQEALMANLPDTVVTVLQNAIDSANKGIVNWVFKHRSMKILSLLTIPCTLPVDIVYATFTKLLACRPKMNLSLSAVCKAILKQAQASSWVSDNWHPPLSHSPAPMSEPQYLPRHSNVSRLGAIDSSIGTNITTQDFILEDDTFEQILQVTNHHDAIMAYYYMDENDKVKITEIYDVTNAEIENFQSPLERDANGQLEFDNDWDDDQINLCDNELEGMIDMTLDEKHILSDPESEWDNGKSSVFSTEDEDSDRPESDQPQARHASKVPISWTQH
ncbi:1-acylglycerol-3-phosphate O-acyltransferase Pnpla3-like [Arctopsyche grandis]|uniref:1-acylglycerol-3-phosphate O-acyltransferase Pnpla3-like n=1 Tax=Arctopsyche grandis TaxID=121162 RepID=UPI00406D7F3F